MKDTARAIFAKVQKALVINHYYYGESDKMPSIKFTYQRSIKSWSHHVSIAYNDNEIFLFTARKMAIPQYKEFLFGSGSDGAEWYKIPVKSAEDVISFLIKHDNFKIKF